MGDGKYCGLCRRDHGAWFWCANVRPPRTPDGFWVLLRQSGERIDYVAVPSMLDVVDAMEVDRG